MGTLGRGLLDTSVILARDEDERWDSSVLPDEAAISVATLAELHYGILVAKTEEARQRRLRRLGAIESTFRTLPIDAAIGRAFATVAHAVKIAGRQPRARVMDLWIAATALAHDVPLYTRNPEDFVGLDRLLDLRAV
jgi:predicted nucleic acid-binding protein